MLLPPPLSKKPLIDERFLKASGKNRLLSQVGLKLDTTSAGADTERVWQHVATEGEYNGYAGGTRGFTFTAQLFTQIVGNFRNHPSYVRGADGLGAADVVAWDFAHASEQSSALGSLPVAGAPAQGWVQELQTRINAEGKAELWALTKWLEPARSYVKEGRYQWASVAVTFDAVDALTGKIVGPVLTSVALTNQPFIEGMNKLAASRSHSTMKAERTAMYIEAAETPERALEMIRNMLGLPETADAAAVSSELNKVKTWASAGESPAGVDIDGLVGGLRTVLNLPTLTTVENVFVEVEKLLGNLAGAPDALVAALPKYLKDAPNQVVALERAALALVPGAKNLPRHVLYRDLVHPAVASLNMKKLAAASSAGTLRLVNEPTRPEIPPPAAQVNQKPVLDVTGHSAGRNATERLLLHVKAMNPGLNHDDAFAYALRLKASRQVVA